MNIIIAIIILSIIVIIHEFGHFIVARANGIAVSEFALGLGPTILKFKKKIPANWGYFQNGHCRNNQTVCQTPCTR